MWLGFVAALSGVVGCATPRSEPPAEEAPASPTLSTKYLLEPATNVGVPQIVVGAFDADKGLLVGYQSETGKRVLFRARVRPVVGGTVAQVLHRDETTGKIAHLMGRARQLDENGLPVRDVEVAGMSVRSLLKSKLSKAPDAQALSQMTAFVSGEAGKAMLDGIPAMYAALDDAQVAPEVEALLEPFGAIAMAMQLTSEQFRGLRSAEAIIGQAQAAQLRSGCGGRAECAYRGRSFTVHSSGLFDALSDRKDISALDGDGTCSSMDAECFGLCGPGCINPGGVAASECFGHDYCACAYSHLDCLLSVPDGCGAAQGIQCHSLGDAVLGWLGGLWDAFWDWVGEFFSDVPDDSTEP
jgi:hypothetical protein